MNILASCRGLPPSSLTTPVRSGLLRFAPSTAPLVRDIMLINAYNHIIKRCSTHLVHFIYTPFNTSSAGIYLPSRHFIPAAQARGIPYVSLMEAWSLQG